MTARMTAGDRSALRTVVRQRMKVLRADVEARKAELINEVHERVAAHFAAQDKVVDQLNDAARLITEKAENEIRTAAEAAQSSHGMTLNYAANRIHGRIGPGLLNAPVFSMQGNEKNMMARRLHLQIEAQVTAALVQIDRQEADLVEELTLDGLSNDAARDFLARIPTVGQLVPTSRLKELSQ